MTVIKSKKQRQSGKRKTLKRKSNKSQKGGMRPPKSARPRIRPGMQSIITPKPNKTAYYYGPENPTGSWKTVETVRRGKTSSQMYGPGSKYSKQTQKSDARTTS